MVVQRTIENLRERPTNERRAVAMGVSIAVMVILFIGWAIFFAHQIQILASQSANASGNTPQTAAVGAAENTGWYSELPSSDPTQQNDGRIEVIEQPDDQAMDQVSQ